VGTASPKVMPAENETRLARHDVQGQIFELDHIFGHNAWGQGGRVNPGENWIPHQVRNDGIFICGVVRGGRCIDLFAEDGTNSVAQVVIKAKLSFRPVLFHRNFQFRTREWGLRQSHPARPLQSRTNQ